MLKYLLVLVVLLPACQTMQEKNLALIRDRADKLKPLSLWKPLRCKVSTHLTQPALARYKEMFPDEKGLSEVGPDYTWRQFHSTCEITPDQHTPLTKNHQAFVETAFCLLLQVHFVHSPFDDLQFKPGEDVGGDDRRAHIY